MTTLLNVKSIQIPPQIADMTGLTIKAVAELRNGD